LAYHYKMFLTLMKENETKVTEHPNNMHS
jgi:hypothetical protein